MNIKAASILTLVALAACTETAPQPTRPELGKDSKPCDPAKQKCTDPALPTTSGDSTVPKSDPVDPKTDPAACPAGSICQKFTAGERELCKRFADEATCNSDRWSASYYSDIKKDHTCTAQVDSKGKGPTLRESDKTDAAILKEIPTGETILRILTSNADCLPDGIKFLKIETKDGTIGYACSQGFRCGQ